MGAAKTTTDHEEIRRWVEQHGGHPATVRRTRSKDNVGIIRIDFPGFSGEQSLEPIEWDEWFEKFDEQNLAFIYQQGKNTNFNKLVRRDPEQVRPSDRTRGPSRTTRGGRAATRALAAEESGKGRSSAKTKRAGSEGARTSSTRASSASSSGRRSATRTSGTRSAGARSSAVRSGGSRTSGSRSAGARSSAVRSGGSRTSGSRSAGARSSAARSGGARSTGRRSQGRASMDLATQTKAELYQRARKAGVERSSAMNKPQLIRALERLGAQAR